MQYIAKLTSKNRISVYLGAKRQKGKAFWEVQHSFKLINLSSISCEYFVFGGQYMVDRVVNCFSFDYECH